MLISIAHASENINEVAKPSTFQSMMPILVILAVFYFLIIRPQSKKLKDQKTMLDNGKIGDEVIILNGVFGKINSIDVNGDTCTVEISPNNNIKLYKTAIIKNISLENRIQSEIKSAIKK